MPNVWCISLLICCTYSRYSMYNRAVAFEPNDKYDPQKFIPERFINDSDTPNPASWAFGFGRRYVLSWRSRSFQPHLTMVEASARENISQKIPCSSKSHPSLRCSTSLRRRKVS